LEMIEVEGMGDEVVVTLAGVCLVLLFLLYKTLAFMADNQESSGSTNITDDGPTRTSNSDCAICLGETRFAVQTNCGHIYCGDCIFEVWRRTSQLSPTSCPYCRTRITLVLTYFSSEEKTTADLAEIDLRNGIIHNTHTYNSRHSGAPRSMMETIRDIPTLFTHLFRRLFSGEDGFTMAFQLRIVVLVLFWVLYLLSPLDLVPEAAFGFVGLLDDIVIFLFLSMYLTTIFRAVMGGIGENLAPGING